MLAPLQEGIVDNNATLASTKPRFLGFHSVRLLNKDFIQAEKKKPAVFQLCLENYLLGFLIRPHEKTTLSYTVGTSIHYWCTLCVTIMAVSGICFQKVSDTVGTFIVSWHTLWVPVGYLVFSWVWFCVFRALFTRELRSTLSIFDCPSYCLRFKNCTSLALMFRVACAFPCPSINAPSFTLPLMQT